MKRPKLASRARLSGGDGGLYDLPSPPSSLPLLTTGCTGLDCVLAGGERPGGYAVGRIINLVGDKSTDKTGLCIEACANFARAFPKGWIRYNEVEAAFDPAYAEVLGLPLKRVQFAAGCFTVSDVFNDMTDAVAQSNHGRPGLYLLDSLDAVSDKAELEADMDKGSYGVGKAKAMSQLFRRLAQKLAKANVTVIIVSQLRDKIGVTFGEKHTRAGGRALDFYASQVIWLANLGQIKKTVRGVDRVVGVKIRARCKKNKVAPPFREFDFPVIFDYGVDDVRANVDWMVEVKRWGGFSDVKPNLWVKRLAGQERDVARKQAGELAQYVRDVWCEIEADFQPVWRKYDD